jgi:GTP-binding protein SAR1
MIITMASIINWVYSSITGSGLWFLTMSGLYTKKANILVIGLDNAGKTTLVGMLINDKFQHHEPTSHPNKEVLNIGGIEFTVHDLGGHVSARRLWKSYYVNTDCVLFMVDVTDVYRMHEVRQELSKIVADLNDVPILIIGNKIDARNACSEAQLRRYLNLSPIDENIGVFMCSIVKRAGIKEAFKWVISRL